MDILARDYSDPRRRTRTYVLGCDDVRRGQSIACPGYMRGLRERSEIRQRLLGVRKIEVLTPH